VASPKPHTVDTNLSEIVGMTRRACQLAQSAVSNAAAGLAKRSAAPFRAVADAERELDRIDREIDERVTSYVTRVSADEARELLACMKFSIDLERIGDLVSSVVSRMDAIGHRVEMADVRDLIRMCTILEKMLVDVEQAFHRRDAECAVSVLRCDAELDRLRNLLHIRHVERPDGDCGSEGVQVLFMAQALERAGDHAKNLAEEVCHFVTGHTVRHILKVHGKSDEQMFLQYLREKQSGRPAE
jgi:phosphate transport system protein